MLVQIAVFWGMGRMNNECMAMLAEQWRQICQNYSADDLLHAFHFVQEHSVILVEEFYKNMLLEKESAQFLTDQMVQQRLRNTKAGDGWTCTCPSRYPFLVNHARCP